MNTKKWVPIALVFFAALLVSGAFIFPSGLALLGMQAYQGNAQTSSELPASPEEIVQAFYDWYIAYEGNPLVDHAYRSSEYLSPDMIAYLDEFTQAGMHYDPVLCAQDVPAEITTTSTEMVGEEANVEIATSFEGHGFTVSLSQVGDVWLIDKITCK
ncbi:MAG: DUF3828 domain-containing protein [Anaerolineales bacterium]|nr:DUF3828 domain-containing protein [Anaerolineales bacterium]